MVLAAGVLSLLIWGYLLLGRGSFWRIRPATPPLPGQEKFVHENPLRVAVIVPARNEADVVGRAVGSLLRQTGPNAIHIFLIDDGSTDSTAQAARDAAVTAGQAERLTVIAGSPLPAGCSGKLWAVQE